MTIVGRAPAVPGAGVGLDDAVGGLEQDARRRHATAGINNAR
jgi:hypothetical protein